MSSQEVTLLEMPSLAMMKILEECDFFSILNLRKVCHSLRNFIDDNPPEECLDEIFAKVVPDAITLHIRHAYGGKYPTCLEYPAGKTITIEYKKLGDTCLVEWKRSDGIREKFLKNSHFVDVFCMDLMYRLNNPKLKLDRFLLNFPCSEFSGPLKKTSYLSLESSSEDANTVLGLIKKLFCVKPEPTYVVKDIQSEINVLAKRVLKNFRNSMKFVKPFHVRNLFINIDGQDELLEFLTYIDNRTLKVLDIGSRIHFSTLCLEKFETKVPNFDINDHLINIDGLFETEHWKNLEGLHNYGYILDAPNFNTLCHLRYFDVTVKNFSFHDFLVLKAEFTKSPTTYCCYIKYTNPDDFRELDRNLIESFHGNYEQNPYFRRLNDESTPKKVQIAIRDYERTIEFRQID